MSRPYCLKCRRPGVTCLCSVIKPVQLNEKANIAVAFVVHPKESRHSVGSVHIIRNSLPGSRLIEGNGFNLDEDHQLRALTEDSNLDVGLLFPGPSSIPLENWAPRPGRARVLVALDGTWSQAKNMLRRSKLLNSINKVSLSPVRPSAYEFRRQPRPECLSTLEAVVESLRVLEAIEPEDEEYLLGVFKKMVKTQIQFQNERFLL